MNAVTTNEKLIVLDQTNIQRRSCVYQIRIQFKQCKCVNKKLRVIDKTSIKLKRHSYVHQTRVHLCICIKY